MPWKHTVEAALLALSSVDQDRASVKNGVGFNARDTGFGNSLARQLGKGKDLSPKQYGTAYRMLKTYRTQLKDFGLDYDLIPPPDGNAPKDAPRYVDFQGGFFYCYFPYDELARDSLKKNVPGRIWSADDKAWLVPAESAAPLGKWAIEHHISVREAALDEMSKTTKKVSSVSAADNKNWQRSWASDADIDVEVPEGFELYGFQKADIDYALRNLKPGKGVYFADEMGLGKTPQSLLTLKIKEAYPAIIAMPRVVWLKWAKEAQTWTPGLRVVLLAGRIVTPKTKLIAHRFGAEIVKLGEPLPDADLYLIKYSVLYKWTKPVGRKVANSKYKKRYSVTGPLKGLKVKGLILDEAHYLKEETAQRTKAGLAITDGLKPETRLALSGTPFLNRHKELLPVLWMLDRLKELAKDDWDFLNVYCNENGYGLKGPFGHFEFNGSPNGKELNFKMRARFMAQHEKKDHKIGDVLIPGVLNQLPAIVPDYIPADLANQSRYDLVEVDLKDKKKEYAQALRRLKTAVSNKTPAPQLGKIRGFVKRLENEVGVLSNEARKVCGEEKVKFSIEWIQDWLDSTESHEKLIVFGYHRIVNEAISSHFNSPLIYGGQNEATRQEAEDSFQEDPAVRLIVCQIESANVGINLTAASAIAFVELPYRPGDLDQAIGRAYGRLNDIHGVNVYYIVYYGDQLGDDATIDEHILDDVLAPKRDIQKRAISGT